MGDRCRDTRFALSWLLAAAAFVALGVEDGLAQRAGDRLNLELSREVLLESGRSVTPSGLVRTKDNGYVVFGSPGGGVPWAIRVDADGQLQWRHSVPIEGEPRHSRSSAYDAAITMPDDSTLLCGNSQPTPALLDYGFLTHLDSSGRILTQRLLVPLGDERFRVRRIRQCLLWADGVALVGYTVRFDGEARTRTDFFWVLKLDSSGAIQWEKLVPLSKKPSGITPPVVLANHDLVVVVNQNWMGDELIRISVDGEIKAQRKRDGNVLLVQSEMPSDVAQAITIGPGKAT